jgi:hypothetical protein
METDMDDDMKLDFLESYGYDDWDTDGMGMLICPCGHRVEDDGHCPDGHTSPLLESGLI